MTRKPRSNITKEDIGTLYTEDCKSVYRLTEYIPPAAEPEVVMQELGGETIDRRPLSHFAKFARLKPDREILKPKRPYTRHEKPVKSDIDLSQLDIKTPEAGTGQCVVTLGDCSVTGETYKDALRNLLNPLGLDTDDKIVKAAKASKSEQGRLILAVFVPK